MTTQKSPYLAENKKPVEIVQELKSEIPSFEEFANSCQYDKSIANSYQLENQAQERSYGPCYYCPYEVNPHKLAGKHINECGSLNCSYYRRITYNRVGGAVGTTASIGAGAGIFATGLALTPFTGGASLVAAAALTSVATTSAAVGGTVLTVAAATEIRNGVENELKLKWENEQNKEKIDKLQNELNSLRKELNEAIKKRDQYKSWWGTSDGDYLRERARAERLESQVKDLKKELCEWRGCGCGGRCL